MYVILMRHAIAMDSKDVVNDETRELTEKGRSNLIEVSKGIKKILPKEIVVLSSPLVRAIQSAEVLTAVLEHATINVSDALANGDHEAFLSNLGTNPLYLAIGHEPFLSKWLFEFTQIKQAFKKTAFAVVEVKENSPIRLICYATPEDIAHVTEGREWFGLLDQWIDVNERIQTEDVTEPILHQYRVLLRTFDTLIYTLKKHNSIFIPSLLESLIDTLMDQTNEIREVDVMINELVEKSELVQLIETLKMRRQNSIDAWKVQRNETLKDQCIELLLFGLIVQYNHTVKKKVWVKDRYNRLIEQVGKKIAKIDLNNDEDIHDTRLLMKKVFYMTKYHSKYLSKESVHIGEYAKEIKNLTGAYLDYKIQCTFLDQISVEFPNLKEEIEAFKDVLDSSIPSTFAIHKMFYKFRKQIGVK